MDVCYVACVLPPFRPSAGWTMGLGLPCLAVVLGQPPPNTAWVRASSKTHSSIDCCLPSELHTCMFHYIVEPGTLHTQG